MGVTTEVIKNQNNPYANVNIKNSNGRTRYFQVPTQNADSFAIQYKKHDKKGSTITNIAFAASIVAGVLTANALTKNIENKFLKFAIGAFGGVITSSASIMACDNYLENKQNSIIANNGAKEVYFEA